MLYLGYGIVILPTMVETSGLLLNMIPYVGATETEVKSHGVIFPGGQYTISRMLSIGGVFSNQKEKGEIKNAFSSETSYFNDNFYTLMAVAKYRFHFTGDLNFYSKVDLGFVLFDSEIIEGDNSTSR